MSIRSFGNKTKPVLILIHGMLTPWEIWKPHVEYFSKDYYIMVPELGGHCGNEEEQFVSIEDECSKIELYLQDNSISEIFAVCGLSLGGTIAYHLWERKRVHIRKLVLDGAPLSKIGTVLKKIMTVNYNSIIEKSKSRDEKTLKNFGEYFLPTEYLQRYLEIADHISSNSISNIMSEISVDMISNKNVDPNCMIYLYGTEMNEYLSKRTVKILKEQGLKNTVCFYGQGHCYKAIYEPEEWCNIVNAFFGK